MQKKLHTKILLILLVVLMTTIGVNYYFGNKILETEFSKAVKAEVFAIGQGLKLQVERLLSYGMPLNDLTGFDELCVEVLTKDNGVTYASVVDLKGTVLFHSDLSHKDNISDIPELYNSLKSKQDNVVEYIFENEKIYGFIIPVFDSNDQHVGSVLLEYPILSITQKTTTLSNYTMILAILLFSFAIFLIASALSLWITKPLLKLYNATREIFYKGTGDMKTVDITTNDEIGRLATSFNMMVSRLKDTTVSKDYVDNIITSMTDALVVIRPDHKIETVNKAATVLLGYSEEELIEQSIDILFEGTGEMPFKGMWLEKLMEQGEYKNTESKFRNKAGVDIPVLLCSSVMKTDNKNFKFIVCTAKDITEIKKAEELMYYQANYDMLTGLFNRYYLESQLTQIVAKTKNNGQCHTFLYLDLDKFKIVNDVCGHNAGDQLMKHLALILKQNLQSDDIIARIGGDEFGILLYNTSASEGYDIADKLCNIIKDFHFSWRDKLFTLGVSIGCVEINRENTDVEWLLSAADRACYISKEKGGNRVHTFTRNDRELTERQGEMWLMSSITKAFDENRFFLVYQPIVSVKPNVNKVWYEVLLRMIDENGNVIMPGAFLPAAQRYNMMPAIDRWVIHYFLSTYKEKNDPATKEASILFNINISGASLNTDSFLNFICEELKKYNVPPEVICFEITETSAVSNFVDTNQFIMKLRSMGCSFALDDFGSGLSSFAYLKYLPVNFIKIDGTFIRNIAKDKIDHAMISSINEVAHLMDMYTIAEYVENQEIFECLKIIGIDYAQGYWLGKPGTIEQNSAVFQSIHSVG